MTREELRDRIGDVLADTIRDDPEMGWSNVGDMDAHLKRHGYRLIGVDGGINIDALAQAVLDLLNLRTYEFIGHNVTRQQVTGWVRDDE